MKREFRSKTLKILIPVIISVIAITVLFLMSTFLWIGISNYKLTEFCFVFRLILQNMGGYSTLLAAIIATIFFGSYTATKADDKDMELKIQNIGHYTLAFQRENDEYKEDFKGDKIVLEIYIDSDFDIDSVDKISEELYVPFFIKFLTSKNCATNLKNIMAFSDEYFTKNQQKIVSKYFDYCEKVKYPSPLYCSAKPTSELENNSKADINRYFNLMIKICNEEIKNIWVSAITDEGVLLFIKVKLKVDKRLNNQKTSYYCQLIQQTSYFKHNRCITALFR
ncbi:hypothetical protein EDC18_101418 [Natranaerovirga pectinivora]|uniref:Uncharacterized protein n=1 Tax=Natranaerovirga pectinivora TaxID=682400 RepID=A0A4R3MTS5_9FIRM|nr:hypothetical protein [Natranaerovirga pectinivora]TCT17120.1 hypothetical protein EDC18_101418 [Natranaerovirga pectinivora]